MSHDPSHDPSHVPIPFSVACGGCGAERRWVGWGSHQDVGLWLHHASQGEDPWRSLSQHTGLQETTADRHWPGWAICTYPHVQVGWLTTADRHWPGWAVGTYSHVQVGWLTTADRHWPGWAVGTYPHFQVGWGSYKLHTIQPLYHQANFKIVVPQRVYCTYIEIALCNQATSL